MSNSLSNNISNNISESIVILVVDDNFINRQYFSMALKKQGYAVELAENGHDAIKQSQCKSFDIIFMDIRMPEIDGYQTAKQIKTLSNNNNTPIIATSAEKSELSEKQVFIDFILKPISPMQLKQCVEKYVNKNNLVSIIFDNEHALKYAYNDVKIMKHLNDMFIQDWPIQLQLLSESIHQNNMQNSLEIIHKLRGSCLTCGALKLENSLEKLSQLIKNNDMINIVKQFKIIENN